MLLAQGPKRDVVRIAVEKAIPPEDIRVVALRVHGRAVVDVRAGVEEHAQVVRLGPAPRLHQGRVMERGILTHAGYARLDQRLRVGALDTPGKRLVCCVFDACVEKTARRQGQTEIAGHRIGLLALVEPAVVQPHLTALGLAPGDEVDDAGDCVAPVLRRGAVAQNLDALQRDARNQADIGGRGRPCRPPVRTPR